MKSSFKLIVSILVLGFLFSNQTIEAQFLKKLKKRVGKAAEEAVIRKTEEKTDRETGKAMDTILGNKGSKKKGTKNQPNSSGNKNPGQNPNDGQNQSSENSTSSTAEFKVSSKFDYVPGDKLLFFEDFSRDYIGDFPSRWNTNGSGEVVTINDGSEKWFELKSGYRTFYIPDLPTELPEDYTIEFDVFTNGIDRQTSSVALLSVILDDNNGFSYGKDYVYAYLPFVQYTNVGIRVENRINGTETVDNSVTADIRQATLNKPHISIAVNKLRYRLWVNEKKYIDVPRLVSPNKMLKYLKFNVKGFKDGKERLFIRNLKIAEGGLDLRRQLIEKGSVSTNGILFDSGSANIQPQSYGIIRQISQVLQQETSMKLNIIGHTDADGSDEINLELSKKRAAAVKNALITTYNISGDRLQTDGKGESVPIGDNNTPDGKAQNRRVEFVKI
jgi:outer membrane protein OmpA-like peptidoglycan-associated protein